MNYSVKILLHLLLFVCSAGLLYMFPMRMIRSATGNRHVSESSKDLYTPLVTFAIAACGDRFEEALVMITSALVLTTGPIHIHVFTEDHQMKQFRDKLVTWRAALRTIFSFTIHSIQYPSQLNSGEWKGLFKPCASQRLFFHEILRDVDAVIYTDTDVAFLRPPSEIWNLFKSFSDQQLMGIARVNDVPNHGWYIQTNQKIPFVPPNGLNSGVIAMNLTRMRAANITDDFITLSIKYRGQLPLGDQDLLSILFHAHPETLYRLSCDMNYCVDDCKPASYCRQALKTGVSVLHGNNLLFHNGVDSVFQSVYNAFRDYRIGNDTRVQLLEGIQSRVTSASKTVCHNISHIFTKHLEKLIVR